ncbi:DUF418 domain-containing protein [Sphingomicrobium sediminis]|uniref:DUF418 domain-containing protein n=1 Tax=Sphingomicrobium sediminis TaxID=2950949 RepID=A0A9X2EHE2_9SPHN|nr:DUF418 domain-containing protein [Sphingomicrobium sediminis]MCM8557587.1 DUF418 domain-containing protein [Sphingomicrobium sediminis]
MATTTQQRILTLDIVRGVAVMGILAMNIYAFSMPLGAYFNPNVYGGDSGINLGTWYADYILFDGKMRGLFSILFGASALLVVEKAMASQKSAAFTHYSRMFWLFLFGMAHYWFIWWGDILAMYALSGLFLFFWRKNSAKVLRNWGIALFGVMTAFSLVQMGGLAAVMSNPDMIPAEDYEGMMENLAVAKIFMGIDTTGVAAEIARMKGDYAGILDWRFNEHRWKMLGFAAQGLPQSIGIMLIGMWLFRNGFLTGSWEAARYKKVATWCLAIGGLGSAAIGYAMMSADFTFMSIMIGMTANGPFQVVMAIGWAALIILLAKKGMEGGLATRLAAAGRMAFTNYLGTSIVMTLVFYGYGLDLYGQFDRFAVNIFVLGMWALILLWSKPILDRYQYGPLEWLWRSLARLKFQPMRKKQIAAA